MKVLETEIEGLLILEPRIFEDDRGYFFESFNESQLPESISQKKWVQDNESKSVRGVLRGLHYQCGDYAQAKLVRVIVGEVYDVAVDIRPDSKTYGEWVGIKLSETNKKQFFIPKGFAHGFVVLSEEAIFYYKCDNYYNKESEGGIIFNDNTLSVNWNITEDDIILSGKDSMLPSFGNHRPIF